MKSCKASGQSINETLQRNRMVRSLCRWATTMTSSSAELRTSPWVKMKICRCLIRLNCSAAWIWTVCQSCRHRNYLVDASNWIFFLFNNLIFCFYRKNETPLSAIDQSLLVQLLQTNPEQPIQSGSSSYHAHKRCSLTPADESSPKRMKSPTLTTAGSLPAARGSSYHPSRGATCGLLELLMEKPVVENQSASVLQNLLVSGRDMKTGHNLKKRNSASSSSSTCFVPLLLSSLSSPVTKV